jgi:peptidoglycan/xylan/chitin deacetylase (PgdA/CDA1 family)
VHSILKAPIERVLSSRRVGRVTRLRVRGKRLILAYHGIIPAGERREGEHALFITQKKFAEHLDMLSRVADVAPLNRLDEEGDGRPRVAITIDDAYRGAVRQGVDELVRRKLPATIFVAPGRLDGHAFWWDCLASTSGTIEDKLRDYALTELEGNDERVRAWAGKQSLPTADSISAYARAATRAELRNAVGRAGITVGSHTWSHANLASLGAQRLRAEVARSRAWLKEEFAEKSIDWLAYPYGLYSAAAQIAAAEASYVGAVSIAGGWHTPSEVSAFARPRLNVPAGLSVAGLEARIVGALRA